MTEQTRTLNGHESVHPDVTIGHVHLKVSDLERAVRFYRDGLGFALTGRLGDQVAFLAAGDYHHHIALNTLESRGGSAPPRGSTGLYHFAVRYPSRCELARAVRRVVDGGTAIDHSADHGVNDAVYLRDPDDNGIELYWDRPSAEWPRDDRGALLLINEPLDLADLLAELEPVAAASRR